MNYNISNKLDLRTYGFKYDGIEYRKQVCVYYQRERNGNKIPHIFMKIIINKENDYFGYKIVTKQGDLYYPFYNRGYGRSSVIDVINVNIEREIKRLLSFGVLTIKNKDGSS